METLHPSGTGHTKPRLQTHAISWARVVMLQDSKTKQCFENITVLTLFVGIRLWMVYLKLTLAYEKLF